MTSDDEEKARQIVEGWYWQPSEGHRYRFRHALDGMVLYKELAPAEADMVALVTEYIRSRSDVRRLVINNKLHTYEAGWDTKDCWFSTTPGDKYEGSDAEKIRIYWALVRPGSDAANGDGPYTVENGCQYAVTHEFYWDVASLPTVPQGSSGVSYTLQGVTRDRETGYFSCVIERRERVKQHVAKYLSETNVFESVSEEQHIGAKQGYVAGVPASCGNGTIVTRKETKNPDCTRDVVNVTTVEKAVQEAVVTKAETRNGTVETVENRNMPSKADAGTLAPGETVTNERTKGGRWNQRIVRLLRAAVVKIRESCRKTIFAHVHVKVENRKTDPGFAHVVEAADGVIVEKTVERTAEGFDITEERTEEKPVGGAVVETARTLRAVSKSVTDRNQATVPSAADLVPGQRVSVRKTDGGRNDVTITTMTPAGVGGTISESCEKNATRHVHSVTKNEAEAPTSEIEAAPEVNVEKSRTVRKTDENTVDVTDQTTRHIPKTVVFQGGATELTQDMKRVGVNIPEVADGVKAEENVEVLRSASPNAHGSLTVEETIRTHVKKTFTGTATGSVTTDEIETIVNFIGKAVASAGPNEEISLSISPNSHGTLTVQKHKRKFQERSATGGSSTKTESVTETVRLDTLVPEVAGAENVFVSNRPNAHGSFDTTRRVVTPKPVDSGWITWRAYNRYRLTYTTWYNCGIRVFKNQNTIPGLRGGVHNMQLSVSINQYGLFDGTLMYRDQET